MRERFRILGIGIMFLIVIGLILSLLSVNSIFIKKHPIEKDFLVPWAGMQTYLKFGTDPYSTEAIQRVQIMVYGKLAKPYQDQFYLNHSFMSELFYFPLALISNFTAARLIWLAILEITLFGSAFLSLLLFDWRLSLPFKILYILFSFFGAQALIPLSNLSPTIIIAFILISGLYCIKIGMDELAGALFAISLFQPSSTGLFLLFVFFWLIKNHRWRVLWGGLILLAFLLIASFALLPGWLLPFVRAVKLEFPFMNYLSSYKLFSELWPAIGTKLAVILTLIVVVLMVYEWRLIPKGNFRWFLWTATLTLVLTPLSGIPTKLLNNQILWIPFSFFLANLIERAEGKKPLLKSGVFLGFISIGIWLIVISFLRLNNDLTFGLFFLFVPPILLLAGLYWIRWWAIHPHRTALENLEHELN